MPAQDGPWGPDALRLCMEWDPEWTRGCFEMSTNPWTDGVLPPKTVELIAIALNAACTGLNATAVRRHVRAALDAGASRDEILTALKMAAFLSIHSCSLGAPILLEEAEAAGLEPPNPSAQGAPTPTVDRTRAAGLWNEAWDPFFELDPAWTEQFMGAGIGVYAGGTISPKLAELMSIALDASYTHMYAPGTRRHVKAALQHGATMEEVMEVLKLCVCNGVQALNVGVPILAEEMAAGESRTNAR